MRAWRNRTMKLSYAVLRPFSPSPPDSRWCRPRSRRPARGSCASSGGRPRASCARAPWRWPRTRRRNADGIGRIRGGRGGGRSPARSRIARRPVRGAGGRGGTEEARGPRRAPAERPRAAGDGAGTAAAGAVRAGGAGAARAAGAAAAAGTRGTGGGGGGGRRAESRLQRLLDRFDEAAGRRGAVERADAGTVEGDRPAALEVDHRDDPRLAAGRARTQRPPDVRLGPLPFLHGAARAHYLEAHGDSAVRVAPTRPRRAWRG